MAVKAVIDTNIWVSALINPHGLPASLRQAFDEGLFTAVISAPLLDELRDVLSRPRIKEKCAITDEDILSLLLLIEELSEETTLTGDVALCRDPNDNMIIETAVRGKAKYLISGDKDIADDKEVLSYLSHHGVSVISPSTFLSVINKT